MAEQNRAIHIFPSRLLTGSKWFLGCLLKKEPSLAWSWQKRISPEQEIRGGWNPFHSLKHLPSLLKFLLDRAASCLPSLPALGLLPSQWVFSFPPSSTGSYKQIQLLIYLLLKQTNRWQVWSQNLIKSNMESSHNPAISIFLIQISRSKKQLDCFEDSSSSQLLSQKYGMKSWVLSQYNITPPSNGSSGCSLTSIL